MKGDLKTKLKHELMNNINSEKDVVFLVVLLRKLLEHGGQKKSFPILTFYCDWTVHPTLKGTGAQEIVKRFDEVESYMEGKHIGTLQEKLVMINAYVSTLRLIDLRNQLQRYLESESLPIILTSDNGRWESFILYYTRVIEASPLRIVDPNKKGMYVDEVVLSVEHTQQHPRPGSEHLALVFRWTWTNKVNGKPWYTESEF
jgi:hypothetical protein